MSVTGTSVEVGLAIQKQPYGDETYDITKQTWYKYRVLQADMSVQQNIQSYQPEVGGPGVPIGEYKGSIMFGGQFTLAPRLKDEFGWLLLAALGDVATTPNSPVTGAHKHLFKFAASPFSLPRVSGRIKIPDTKGGYYGQYGYDGFLTELNFGAAANGQITSSFTLIARDGGTAHTLTGWTNANATNPLVTTAPLAQNGSLKVLDETYRTVSLGVRLQNMTTGVQDEQTVGRLTAGDLTVLGRMAEIRFGVIYEDGKLLSRLIANSPVGTTISPEVFRTLTGGSSAFETYFESQDNAVGTTKYRMTIRANNVTWKLGRPPVAQANQLMTFELIGTVVEPVAGNYFEIEVINNTAAYALPVAPVLGGASAALQFNEADSALTIDNTMTFTSPLSNLNGGTLRAEIISNNSATTEITMTVGTIGTVDGTEDGTAGKAYLVALDTDATPAAIQTAIRTLAFEDTSGTPNLGWRTLKITINDGLGGIATRYYYINVV